jgi:hypothetical protein
VERPTEGFTPRIQAKLNLRSEALLREAERIRTFSGLQSGDRTRPDLFLDQPHPSSYRQFHPGIGFHPRVEEEDVDILNLACHRVEASNNAVVDFILILV